MEPAMLDDGTTEKDRAILILTDTVEIIAKQMAGMLGTENWAAIQNQAHMKAVEKFKKEHPGQLLLAEATPC
jgi:hypothetical protein